MGFLKKLEKNRVGQLVCFLGLEVLILGLYFVGGKWVTEQGEKGRLSTQSVVIDYDILAQIEDVSTEGCDLVFSGWALRSEDRRCG